MLDPKKLEEIARQIADSVPPGVKNMAEEAEGKIKISLMKIPLILTDGGGGG